MNGRSSSSSIADSSSSNSTNVTPAEAYMNQIIKPLSAAQIRAQGDVDTRLKIINIVGVVSVILALAGSAAFLIYPDKSKDLWVIIGPILSSMITGTIGFLSGEKSGANK